MTIDTVFARTRSAAQVPIPVHSPVRTVFEIRQLLAVALRAQLHHVRELDSGAVGQFERVVIRGVVTGKAGEISVRDRQSRMKLI